MINYTGTRKHDPLTGGDYEVRYQTGLGSATPSRGEDEMLIIRLDGRPRIVAGNTIPQLERTISIALWLSEFKEIHHITDTPQAGHGAGISNAKESEIWH
jgi:hypothetical protein